MAEQLVKYTMMTCDRCGVRWTTLQSPNAPTGHLDIAITNPNADFGTLKTCWDLCDICLKGLQAYLGTGIDRQEELKKRLVTPAQLRQGYAITRNGRVTYHKYEVLYQLDDGNYAVREPEVRPDADARDPWP